MQQRLIGLALVGEDALAAGGGEAAGAGLLARVELGLAGRQRAKRRGDGGNRLGLVEIAHQRQLDRAARQPVADRGLEPGVVEREEGFLRLEREARIIVGQDPAQRRAQRVARRRIERGEVIVDPLAEPLLALAAIARIGQQRGEHL